MALVNKFNTVYSKLNNHLQQTGRLSFMLTLLPIAVLLPSFIRSGDAFYKITGIQPTTVSIALVLGFLFLRIRRSKPLLSRTYQNMLLLLSLSFAALAVMAISILAATFPNFIYAATHIRVEILGYLVALSLCIWLTQKENHFFVKNAKRLLFFSPIVFLGICLLLLLLPNNLLYEMTREDRIVEIAQFAALISAGVSGIVVGFKRLSKHLLQGIILMLVGIILLGVAGEEISWGQRLLHFHHEGLQSMNVQNETTVHNIQGVHGTIPMMYAVIGFMGSIGSLLVNKLTLVPRETKSFLLPSSTLFFFYFIPFIYNLVAINYGPLTEATELILYLGMLFFLLQTRIAEKTKTA